MNNIDFVDNAKGAVLELLRVVKAPIDYSIYNEAEKKKALQTKKQAILQAKDIISGLMKMDTAHKKWAEKSIKDLISAGQESINAIFEGLGSKIDAKDDEGNTDYVQLSSAISAKGIAFNDSLQLFDLINELKQFAENSNIEIGDSDYKIGYAEMYADNLQPSLAGVQKDGVIAIDPNGTIGDKVHVYGLDIYLPYLNPIGRGKEKVYETAEEKTKQVWKRMPMPDITPLNASQYTKYIDKEYKRRRDGVWFTNNGKLEYITGAHWLFLQHLRTEADGGYFFFSKMQQKLFWFMEAVWVDDRCYGLILEKIRRGGFSHCFLAFMLCKTLMYKDKLSGMTSKTEGDAQMLFEKLTKMFASLPFYFKPVTRVERPKKALEFMAPSSRLTKEKKTQQKDSDYLNTTINYEATKADSYDGTALFIYIADEFSKWTKSMGNTLTHYDMVRKCVTKGKRITGKIFILSTIENVTGLSADDPDALAGDRFKDLFYDSDPNERDANGRTTSGLYKLFIPADEHYEGFIDKYGYMVVRDPFASSTGVRGIDGQMIRIGFDTFYRREIDALGGNLKKIMEHRRKTPRTEADGFAIAEGVCAFNQANIARQMVYNESLYPVPYRTGNFQWVGEQDSGKVEWVDNPEGRFKVSWLPSNPCHVMRRNGYWIPLNANVGAFGVDPYRVSRTVDNKGSKGAIHGFSIQNTIGAPQHNFFLEYVNRPKSKEVFFDDCIMALVYYGMPVLIENNVNNLLDELYRRNYSKFSLKRPDKAKDKLSDDERKYGGIPSSSENVIQMMSAALENFIEYHVGDGAMCFNRTLQDWLVFDDRNRTKRDASISSSLALLAVQHLIRQKPKEEEENASKPMLIKLYNNKGEYTQ